MRTQRAHYGCGTVSRHGCLLWCASSGNACGEEMTEERDGGGGGKRDRADWGKHEDEDGEGFRGLKWKKKAKWSTHGAETKKWKEKHKLKVRGHKMELSETQTAADRSCWSDHFPPPPCASHQTIATREGDRTRNTNKWTEPPVKEKHKPQSHYTYTYAHTHTHAWATHWHTHIPCMNSPLVCSRAERDSSVSLNAATSVISATAPAWKHTYTEVTVSTNLFICLGGTGLFYIHACF